jgi:hypothetical protein
MKFRKESRISSNESAAFQSKRMSFETHFTGVTTCGIRAKLAIFGAGPE